MKTKDTTTQPIDILAVAARQSGLAQDRLLASHFAQSSPHATVEATSAEMDVLLAEADKARVRKLIMDIYQSDDGT